MFGEAFAKSRVGDQPGHPLRSQRGRARFSRASKAPGRFGAPPAYPFRTGAGVGRSGVRVSFFDAWGLMSAPVYGLVAQLVRAHA